MTGEVKNIERIDRYLQGNMTLEESTQFEKDLQNNPTLKEACEFYKDTQMAVEHNTLKSLKQSLQKTEQHQKKRRRNSFYLRMAAASLLLIAAIGYLFNQSDPLDHGAVFSEYYKAYPNIADPISRSSQTKATNAYHLYEQRAYEQVIGILESPDYVSDTAQFYLGQAQLALGELAESKENLSAIDSTSVFYEASQWYIALIYLKSDEEEQLKSQLRSIDSKNSYYERAQSLLKKVKR